MAAEVSITLKNDEKRQTMKHLVYEELKCDIYADPLASLIADATAQFNAEVDDMQIKIKLTVA